MLYREIIAVCSQIYTKHISTLCGQNGELLIVKLAVHLLTTGGIYSDHCAVYIVTAGLCIHRVQRSTAVCYLKINSQLKRTVQRLNRSIETHPLSDRNKWWRLGVEPWAEGRREVGWRRSENMKSCQYKSLFVSCLRTIGALCVCRSVPTTRPSK